MLRLARFGKPIGALAKGSYRWTAFGPWTGSPVRGATPLDLQVREGTPLVIDPTAWLHALGAIRRSLTPRLRQTSGKEIAFQLERLERSVQNRVGDAGGGSVEGARE